MATRGVEMTIAFVAWDTSANAGKTSDSANFTLRYIKDGTSSAPTNSASEVDATNAPGVYKITLTAAETAANIGVLAGKSSTANVSIIPVTIQFERLPDAAPGASTGVALTGDIATALNTTTQTESYATDGSAATITQLLYMIYGLLAEPSYSGTTLTVKKLDGSTTAMTFTLDDSTSPTGMTRSS